MQLIILGMHRSGTSVLARLLNMMGAYFGPEGISTGASNENPKGFWERRDVRQLNDFVLHSVDCDWNKVANFDVNALPDAVITEFKEKASKIVLEMDSHRPWLLKEPRLCLLFNLWKELLEVPVCIHIYRNPVEVANSLYTRNAIPSHVGIALWEKYNLSALEASNGLPGFVVSHNKLMKDTTSEVKFIYNQLLNCGVYGLRLPSEKEVTSFISKDLYREKVSDVELAQFLNVKQTKIYNEFISGLILKRKNKYRMCKSSILSLKQYEKIENTKNNINQQLSQKEQDAKHALATATKVEADLKQQLVQQKKDISQQLGQKEQDARQALATANKVEADLRQQLAQQKKDISQQLGQKEQDARQALATATKVEADLKRQLVQQEKDLSKQLNQKEQDARHALATAAKVEADLKRQLAQQKKDLSKQLNQKEQDAKQALATTTKVEADLRQQLQQQIGQLTLVKKGIVGIDQYIAKQDEIINQLFKGIDSLVTSRRWLFGNAIFSLRHKLLFRKVPDMATDYLKMVQERYKSIKLIKNPMHVHVLEILDNELIDCNKSQSLLVETNMKQEQEIRTFLVKSEVDIIICVHNALDDVKLCINSVRNHTEIPYHLIIVNDASDSPTQHYLHSLQNIELIENSENMGYTKSANRGFRASKAPYKVVLNSDTQVSIGWLNALLQTLNSHPKAGLVGALSNAASYQSVPLVFQSGSKEWYMAEPPMDKQRWAEIVSEATQQSRYWLPNINGFCMAIRQSVFDAIGYFDEENYPWGYGEENDFCLRAQDAGFLTLVATKAYVFHAKSKSFTHQRRRKLSAQSGKNYSRKYGLVRLEWNTHFLNQLNPMDAQRRRLQKILDQEHRLRIAYILPLTFLHSGGVISVMQAVQHMTTLLGVDVSVIIPAAFQNEVVKTFNLTKDQVLGYDNVDDISGIAKVFDILIATHNSSVIYVRNTLSLAQKSILPAYFVQDYEPWFSKIGSNSYRQAVESYTLIPEQVLFSKTQYLVDTVRQQQDNVNIYKIRPGFDIDLYKPDARYLPDHDVLRICAMIRPVSPRRAPQETLDVLEKVQQSYPGQIEINIFGCNREDLNKLHVNKEFIHHGVLDQQQLFKLLQENDMFLDMSPYQAFGRTGLEAMAAGCLAVLPGSCGTAEYADENNALLLDMRDKEQVISKLCELVENPKRRMCMKQRAFETVLSYNCMGDVLTQWELLNGEYRFQFNPPKVSLIMLVHNKHEMTKVCLDSLEMQIGYDNYELIIIDNASDQVTKNVLQQAAVRNLKINIITNQENRSFSEASNQGVELAKGELLLLINNDIEFINNDWLTKLVHVLLTQPLTAAVGPCMMFPDGNVQSSGVKIKIDADTYSFLGAEEICSVMPSRYVDAVSCACMLIWKDIYNAIGGLDERYWYGQEDVDLCLTMRAKGYQIYHCTESVIVHHESKTRSYNKTTLINREAIREKWQRKLINIVEKL